MHRHDTGNVAHTNSDDLFNAYWLVADAWKHNWAAARAHATAAPPLRPSLETWPVGAPAQPLVVFTDGYSGWLGENYTATVLPGMTTVRGHAALLASTSPERPLVCFRDVAVGVGGRALFRGAGFGWDFAWTWSNDDGGWSRGSFLAESREWFDHLRAVHGLPGLAAAGREFMAKRAMQVAREEVAARVVGERTVLIVNRRATRTRHIANTRELAAALSALPAVAAAGLRVTEIDWEGLPIQDVARALSSADVVISVHGAGNAHVGFATPGSTWIELVPEDCGIVESMYAALARRAGVIWRHLPIARRSCLTEGWDSPGSVWPGRMCKDPLGLAGEGFDFLADSGPISAMVTAALSPPQAQPVPVANLIGLLPQGPLTSHVAGLLRGSFARKVRPVPSPSVEEAATKPPRVVIFASLSRLTGLGMTVAALTSKMDGERPHKAVPASQLSQCLESRPNGMRGCFQPEGLYAQHAGAPLGHKGKLLLLDDTEAPTVGSEALAAWVDAVRGAEVVVAMHGSTAVALLPLLPLHSDWVVLVPPRDAARAVAYHHLASAAGVELHVHQLQDPSHDCGTPAWERPQLKVDGVALAARVSTLLATADM